MRVALTTHRVVLVTTSVPAGTPWSIPGPGPLTLRASVYRVAYDAELLRKISSHVKAFTPAERASLVADQWALVRCGKAPYSLIKRTVEALGHDRIIGVIMNAVDFAHDRNAGGYYEYYGYGYYGTAPGKKK